MTLLEKASSNCWSENES